jgi:glycerol-3-phosphate acyltransferase PlsY
MSLCILLMAYLIGSISFAWLVARAHGVDLRAVGSGNLGATNVGRALGGTWFAVVFLLDVAKGAGPVLASLWIATTFSPPGQPPAAGVQAATAAWLPVATGIAAVIGHVLPLWHGLRGGKAVATSLGVVVALAPLPAAIAFAAWLPVWIVGWTVFGLKKSEPVGIASVVGAMVAPIARLVRTPDPWSSENAPV